MNATKRILVATLAATWAILLLGGAFRPQGYSPSGPPRPQVGYQAPDLEVVGPDLKPISLADLRGKAVFLNFWASWCGPCRMEMPEIQRLHDSLPEGSAILAVNMTPQELSTDTPIQYLAQSGYTFPVALDLSGEAGQRFQALSLPTSLFISPDGLVTARISGPLSQRAMAEYLATAAATRRSDQPSSSAAVRPSLGAYLPEAFSLGPLVLPTRALAWVIGGIVAYLLAGLRVGRGQAAAEEKATAAQDLVLNLAIGGVLGAKLLYIALDPVAYLNSPSLLIAFPYGELTLPGAALGGIALAAWGVRRQKERLLLFDQAAPGLILGAAVGALGSPDPGHWALGPLLLVAGLAALWMRARAAQPGQTFASAALITALALVLADLPRPIASTSGVSTLQLVSAAIGTAAYLWQSKQIATNRQPR